MENKKSSNKSFGIVFSFFFALIILYKFFKYGVIDLKLIFICVVFLTFTYIYPAIFSPLNKLWIKFGDLLGLIVPPIVMFDCTSDCNVCYIFYCNFNNIYNFKNF